MMKHGFVHIGNDVFYTPDEIFGMYVFYRRFFVYTGPGRQDGEWQHWKINAYLGEDVLKADDRISSNIFERLMVVAKERGDM